MQTVRNRGVFVRRWILASGMCAVIGFAGCGGGAPALPEEKLIPVTGEVRFGGTPTAGIRVLFTPKGSGGNAAGGGFGMTDAEGKYKLVHRSNKEGVGPGEYTVTFSKFVKPDGSSPGPNESPYMSGAKESIPAMWSDPTKAATHNSVTVGEGQKPLDFAIPKK
jgi:hypothetical protein